MFISRFITPAFNRLVAGTLLACLLPGLSFAASMDERIDLSLAALELPLVQSQPIAPTTLTEAPVNPPYKQAPPAAQSDFRSNGNPPVK